MNATLVGAALFGVVTGWVTYRTLRRTKPNGLSDIATVLGAVGGATVTGLFPKESEAFGWYGIGLAVGFFLYLIIAAVAGRRDNLPLNEWLGEAHTQGSVPKGRVLPPIQQ